MSFAFRERLVVAPTAVEMSELAGGICPECGAGMVQGSGSRSRPTRDHILPVVRGGGVFIHGDVRNYRLLCAGCNELLATCGHCPGAVAAVRDIAAREGQAAVSIAARWRLPEIGRQDGGRRAVPGKEGKKRWYELQHMNRGFSQSVLAPPPKATLADVWPGAKAAP